MLKNRMVFLTLPKVTDFKVVLKNKDYKLSKLNFGNVFFYRYFLSKYEN